MKGRIIRVLTLAAVLTIGTAFSPSTVHAAITPRLPASPTLDRHTPTTVMNFDDMMDLIGTKDITPCSQSDGSTSTVTIRIPKDGYLLMYGSDTRVNSMDEAHLAYSLTQGMQFTLCCRM